MAKEEVHINMDTLKSIIRESVKPLLESSWSRYYGMSGNATYYPGETADITPEEFDEFNDMLQSEYIISYHTGGRRDLGWNTPNEEEVRPDENDINKVLSDIEKIPDEHVRNAYKEEFRQWLQEAEPDLDYNEPDDEDDYDYDDDLYENKINENMNNNNFVIQTRTGGYLMDIQDDTVEYDDDTLVISAIVGRSPVQILVPKYDYEMLVNEGKPCEGTFQVLGKGGDATPESPCTITIYNG